MGKGKKKDKKKKGLGMEKTMAKLAKKEQRRGKQAKAAKGKKKGGKADAQDDEFDDIDAILAGIAAEKKKATEIRIEACPAPSPRIHASFVVHPLNPEKMILFGGEFYDGKTDRTYGDHLIFNSKNNKWSKVTGPGAPLPRLAHQAVGIPARDGEVWMFAGHFNSPKQGFRHQNELWVLHLKENRWERVDAKGAPSPRSGHRMVAHRNKLVVFGGYYDSPKMCLYYSDLFIFDTDKRTWTEIKRPGKAGPTTWPSERSGFNMSIWEKTTVDPPTTCALVYGGMRVENKGKFTDVGVTEQDLWTLTLPASDDDTNAFNWKRLEAPGAVIPSKRLGMGMVVHNDQMIFFGGVEDKETRWDLKSKHFAELRYYNLISRKAGRIQLKSDIDLPQPPQPPSITKVVVGYERVEVHFTEADGRGLPILSYTVSVRPTGEKVHGPRSPILVNGLQNGQKYTFFVSATNGAGKGEPSQPSEQVAPTALRDTSLAPLKYRNKKDTKGDNKKELEEQDMEDDGAKSEADGAAAVAEVKDKIKANKYADAPTPRQASMVCHSGNSLFVFGGAFEAKAREYMFNDLYSLDLNKRDKWKVIQKINTDDQVWYGSDEDDDEDEDEDDDNDENEDDEDGEDGAWDIPKQGENMKDFFTRGKDQWTKVAAQQNPTASEKEWRKLAFELAKAAYEKSDN